MRGLSIAAVAAVALLVALPGCKGPIDEKARAAWKQRRGNATLVVLPVIVRHGQRTEYDATAAETIAGFITANRYGSARMETAEVAVGSWHTNQARMFGESAKAIAGWRKSQPSLKDAEYVVTVEALYLGGTDELTGVHLYLVDAEGRFADGVLLNSHHDIFQKRKPKTVKECVGMALEAWKMSENE